MMASERGGPQQILATRSGGSALRLAILAAVWVLAVFLSASLKPAQALPAFARQTGEPCAACHTAFPELTPFGRRFKLSGYLMEGGGPSSHLAAMFHETFTNTQSKQDAPPSPGLKTDDNTVLQQATALIGGKIYGDLDLGVFIQLTAYPGTGQVNLDQSDARYVKPIQLFGKDGFFGIDATNAPTMEDAWNTLSAWSFPEISPMFAANSIPGTHMDYLSTQVAGAGMYVFLDDKYYADVHLYGGLNKSTLEVLGEQPGPTPDIQAGAIPYWRFAFEPHWGDHYLMVGTSGLYGQTIPGGVYGVGTDKYLDLGLDSEYQYDGDKYSVTVKASDVYETQQYNASFLSGATSNIRDWENNLHINASYVWDHTYSISAGIFDVVRSKDLNLNTIAVGGTPGTGAPFASSPNGNGLVFDLAYIPFSHGSPWPYSTYNERFGIQYIKYNQLYGGNNNFDGTGLGRTHNAAGNNTLFLYAWLMW